MGKLIDLTGRRFGRLVVLKRGNNDSSGGPAWVCICDCGNTKVVSGSELRRGRTQSCGCLQKGIVTKNNFRHGEAREHLYTIWQAIKQRIYTKNSKHYKNYGGRGLTICEEWDKNYLAFKKWAIESGYSDGLTIDRIDNNIGYYPENCRWVNRKTQANNRRTNHFLSFHGEIKTISEWAETVQINKNTIIGRLTRGWSVERALTEPVKK